jgi:xylan 1,4-beta-xylosidase
MEGFLDHVLQGTNYATGGSGTPLDFVSFHAKGAPTVADGHVRMGIREQLETVDQAFRMFAARPALRGKPVIIGESDPEGCAACQGARFNYRNGSVYSSYTAASFARLYELAARHQVNLQGALTWAFEFEDQPYFAGFRQLASNGIDLPVLNVFRMMSLMRGQRLPAKSSAQIALDELLAQGVRGAPDVGVLASRGGDQLAVLLWHYHDDDVPGSDAQVDLDLAGLKWKTATVTHFRVDDTHGNAYAAWQRLGSPASIDQATWDSLRAAGKLTALQEPRVEKLSGGKLRLSFALPRQAVSLLLLSEPSRHQIVPAGL